jgi:hypothetical protein
LVITATATETGSYINTATIESAAQADPVTGNNQDTAAVDVIPVQTISSMINALITQVQDFETNGLMKRYPAADLVTTLKFALRQTELSNTNSAIQQLRLFIAILNRMVEIDYISGQHAKLLIDAANATITKLLQTQQLSPLRRAQDTTNDMMENITTGIYFNTYPNPFSGRLGIQFNNIKPGLVSLVVYDANGKLTATLFNTNLPAGNHRLSWPATSLPGGLYFVHLHINGRSHVRPVILSR